jgi:hypothetical protein
MFVLDSKLREAFEKQVAAHEDHVQTYEALLRDERAARRAAELTIQELVFSSPTPHPSRPQSRTSPRDSSQSHSAFTSPPSISQHSTTAAQHETDHDPYCTPPASPPPTRVIHLSRPLLPAQPHTHNLKHRQARPRPHRSASSHHLLLLLPTESPKTWSHNPPPSTDKHA